MISILIYSIYIFSTIIITYYVGKKLFKDGSVWLNYLFEGDVMAEKINRILLLGYYLVNIGYIFYAISNWGNQNSWQDSINILSQKISLILIILCFLHYQNILLINLFFTIKLQKKWKL